MSLIFRNAAFFVMLFLMACTFSQKIKDGETAYERKQYANALVLLEEEYTNTKNEAVKGRKAFLLGKCYQRILEYSDARKWYDKAVSHNYGPEALGNYANMCKSLEDYDTAILAYQKVGAITGRKQEIDREILICRQAAENKRKKPEYQIERIFENSSVSDYSPVLFESDFLVFTSERKEATGKDIYGWTGERFSDIFIMRKNGSDVRRFDSAINSNHNDGAPCFTKDMQTMYFTRCFNLGSGDDHCKIMVSTREGGLWSEPEVLPFVQEKINYGQATLLENDSILVFSSDFSQPGGQLDLFYTEWISDGAWSEPEKLPSTINTPGNEVFPTSDSDTLYFSSDYLPGFGGFDIFKTYLRKDRTWTIPINVGYPVNSGGDDFSFVVDYNAKPKTNVVLQGYFCSSRPGSGKDDIFRFSKIRTEPQDTTTIPVQTIPKEVYLTIRTYTPNYAIPDDPNSMVTGKSSLGETFIKVTGNSNTRIAESYTDKNGFFFTNVPENNQIRITGVKSGYLAASRQISTSALVFKEGENTFTINEELILDKIYENKEINLKNIYYDYDKWDIKEEARPTLDALTVILNDNPQIRIQLSSHTDCRGTEEYNLELSQKRAQSVVDYLIAKGIQSDRLVATGYGESQLIDTCVCEKCSEAQHQTNRRTTFKILKK